VGIGRALALLCARQGAAPAVADVDPAAAEATAQLIRDQGARAEAVAFDASERPKSPTASSKPPPHAAASTAWR